MRTARRLVVASLLVTALPVTGWAARAATSPRPAAAAVHETGRPASCPAAASDPNSPAAGPRTPTGTFPWPPVPAGVNPQDYRSFDHTPAVSPPLRPTNWGDGGTDWKYTSARSADPQVTHNPQELCGVEGDTVDRAWQTTTGRPTTLIAISDSGIEWCDAGIVDKVYVNRAAVPLPENAQGLTKPQLQAQGVRFRTSDPYDLNDDGVFNVADFARDPRIARPFFCGSFISSEDLIRAFGHDGRQGPAGFTEAISGWNFVDNSNDPYDDVHYDHGTGEAHDATGAANSTSKPGACPNCMVLPLRVGDSFIAQSDAFAQAVLFAVDSGATVMQEALGTLDDTTLTRQAVQYAYRHGVPIVASAADEQAGHHNLPGVLPHMLVVNSATQVPTAGGVPLYDPPSYLYLNGCTNYGANVMVTVETASCSSEAAGQTGGIVGLAESAAVDALQAGRLAPYPGLRNVATGAPIPLSANEMQQLVTMSADDVDFQTPALPYGPPDNYAVVAPVPTRRYPTQPGYDQYTGYGRIDAGRIVQWISRGVIPPEASIDSPEWYTTQDPAQTLTVRGFVAAVRAHHYSWQLQAGVGPQPEPNGWATLATGSGSHPFSGVLARIPMSRVAALFPAGSTFTGGDVGVADRPEPDKFTYTLRLVVTDDRGLTGADRRTGFLHHDPTLLPGFPKFLGGSVDAAPTYAPIGPGGSDALVVATADGDIHAFRPNGTELPGWPVHTDPLDYHAGEPAWSTGDVTAVPRGAVIGGVAVGDLAAARGHDLDVVAADWTGRVYAWDSGGHLLPGFPVRTDPAFSGPAVRDPHNRVLRGIVGAPALADLEGDGRLDIVASSMDRHVYAWRPDGQAVPGWPVLVIDPHEVAAVDPVTNKVTFLPSSHVTQGTKLLDTPAIGALSGGGRPDVVVGSNEEYTGQPNISVANPINFTLGSAPLLSPANSRVYAIAPTGSDTAAPAGAPRPAGMPDPGAFVPGWPVQIADLDSSLLPDVGDGVTASPSLADVDGSGRLRTGVISTVGPGYVLNPDGTSYYGNGPDGRYRVLSTQPAGPLADSPEYPSLPAVGMGIFSTLGPAAPGVSFVAPAASLGKALDTALPAQQPVNDNQVDAWSVTTAHFLPGFPHVMEDLQFIVQPIVADVAGASAGPYIVEGSALSDVRAVNALGQEAPDFPKFTGGWMVNSPALGAWGGLADQVLALGTREGYLFAWSTPTTRCASSGPWPKEHHDLWNTGNLQTTAAPAFGCGAAGPAAPAGTLTQVLPDGTRRRAGPI